MSKQEPVADDNEQRRLHRALIDIGKIAAPSSIILAFCEVLQLPPATSAMVVLGVIGILSLCIYRSWLNRHIPATLVLFLLICLTGLFYANYQSILLKDTGLVRYYKKSADLQQDLRASIESAKHDIWFFGVNFHISATDQREAILSRLRAGVRVHYLIFDPTSKAMAHLATDFDQSPKDLQAECDNGMESIRDLFSKWSTESSNWATPGDLEVKTYDTTPRARAYVIDPDTPTACSYIVPYINNVNSPELPGFKFANAPDGVYKDYYAGILKLWKAARKLDLSAK